MISSRFRVGVRSVLLGAALSLTACSGEAVDFLPEPKSSALPADALIWRDGSGGTLTYRGDNQLIRCWKLNTRFDCLHAEIFDFRDQIADAPVRRSYFRFLTTRLPDRTAQLQGLDSSDGYECFSSVSPERSYLHEGIWKNGRVVEESFADNQVSTPTVWSLHDIAERFQAHAVSPRRPAFACSLVEEITAKMGLETLDSPLITYDALTSVKPVLSEEVTPETAE